MSDLPKLAKDMGLLAPKNARRAGAIAKAILTGGTLIAGAHLDATVVSQSNVPALPRIQTQIATGRSAPLILQSRNALEMAQTQREPHQSHTSHGSHSSHSSHSSHTSSGF
jgi:hypothetical protein